MSKWSFSENYYWRNEFPQCGGPYQSPINLDIISVAKSTYDNALKFENSFSENFSIFFGKNKPPSSERPLIKICSNLRLILSFLVLKYSMIFYTR